MTRSVSYNGYEGTIKPSLEDGSLYGKVAFIRDLITYEALTVRELENAFGISVDEYLNDCKELEKEPDKPFKGVFNVRTGPELHRSAVMAASGQSLNAFVCDAIR